MGEKILLEMYREKYGNDTENHHHHHDKNHHETNEAADCMYLVRAFPTVRLGPTVGPRDIRGAPSTFGIRMQLATKNFFDSAIRMILGKVLSFQRRRRKRRRRRNKRWYKVVIRLLKGDMTKRKRLQEEEKEKKARMDGWMLTIRVGGQIFRTSCSTGMGLGSLK